jgi:hypothetical protein
VVVKTTAYNGQVPGPLLRVREGVPVTIDVTNASANSDIVHWHGLAIDSLNDGAMEEGSPMIAPGGTLRYSYTPKPGGRAGTTPTRGRAAIFRWGLTAGSLDFCWWKGSRTAGLRSGDFSCHSSLGAVFCADGGDDAG